MSVDSSRSVLIALLVLGCAATAQAQTIRGALTAGREVSAELTSAGSAILPDSDGPEHAYTLATRAGQVYQIDLMSSYFDPVLRVLEGDARQRADAWTLLMQDDDGGENTNSRVRLVGTGQTLIVVAGSYAGQGSGYYALRVTETAQTFRPVAFALGRTVQGNLSDASYLVPSGHPADFYTVSLRAGQEVTFDAESDEMDTYLEIYGSAEDAQRGQRALAEDDDSGPGVSARLAFRAPRAGTYVLRVRPFAQAASGSYTLSSASGLLEPYEEPAFEDDFYYDGEDGFEMFDFGQQGWEEYTGDEPVVRAMLTAADLASASGSGARFTFRMNAGDTFDALVISDDFDAVAEVLDGAGNSVAYNDDSGHGTFGRDAFVAFTAEQTGTYTLVVRSYNGQDTGAFRVQHRGGQNLRAVR
ncbi:MAG: PPC domain-containing protein [Rubricoccaceae bacterium]